MSQKAIITLTTIGLSLLSIIVFFFYSLFKGHKEWKDNLKQTPADRQFSTKEKFVNHFTKKGFSLKTSNFVYDNTQKSIRATDIVLLPHDDLLDLYDRPKDQWFYIINKWFKKLGKKPPDEKAFNDLIAIHTTINFDLLHDIVEKYA